MDKNGKYENRLSTVMMSCDAFFSAFTVMFLLFLLPYVFENGLLFAAAFLPIACVLPFAVMPLLYSLVHRFDPLLFGRYHLFMPLSGFLAALMFVFVFGGDGSAGGSCLLFFGATATLIFTLFYRYCSFSVRARLAGDNVAKPTVATRVFSAFGGVCAVALAYGFYKYEPQTVLLNAAYIIAAIAAIMVITQYLFTFYGIPKLGGKRVQSIKSVFRAFYGDLHKRTFFSSLFFTAAFLTLAFMLVGFSAWVGAAYLPIVCAAITVVAFICGDFIVTEKVRRRSRVLSVIDILCIVSAAGLMTVLIFVDMPTAASAVLLSVAALIIGGGGAVVYGQTRLRMLTVKPRVTSGVVFILIALVVSAAAGIALGVNVPVYAALNATGEKLQFVYGTCGAAVFAVIGFVAARKRQGKGDNIPELSYELNTEEIRRAGGFAAGNAENGDRPADIS